MKETEKIFSIKKDLYKYIPFVADSWRAVLDGEVTKYPILVFSPMPIEVGVLLVHRDSAPGNWSTHISSLEEFSIKGLVQEDKVKDFMSVYKSPLSHYCAFVISDLGAQFLFLPHNEQE